MLWGTSTASCHIILSCAALCCAVLCCAVLCCAGMCFVLILLFSASFLVRKRCATCSQRCGPSSRCHFNLGISIHLGTAVVLCLMSQKVACPCCLAAFTSLQCCCVACMGLYSLHASATSLLSITHAHVGVCARAANKEKHANTSAQQPDIKQDVSCIPIYGLLMSGHLPSRHRSRLQTEPQYLESAWRSRNTKQSLGNVGQPLSGSQSSSWVEGEMSQDFQDDSYQSSGATRGAKMKGHRGDFRSESACANAHTAAALQYGMFCG